MASKTVRMVNVIPAKKIKKEVIDDDDDDYVSCKLCSKKFASEMALANHAKIEHMEALMAGEDLCVRIFKRVRAKRFTHDQLKVIQLKTDKMLSTMKPMNIHELASADVGYIIIRDDSVPSDSKEKQAKNERREKEKPKLEKVPIPISGPFECLQPSKVVADGTCHQMFFSCCDYSTHFRDEHTLRRKGLRCQVCERPLVAERNAPFSCQTCGAGFESNKDLSDHCNREHVKLKPFKCSVCNKRFTQQGGLQQHMRAHTGDRPFPCTYCSKAFTQKSGLDQHLRIHTKFKPYRCVICGKTFCQSVHLQQHMRTHTNVAPFQCAICQKRFKQSSHLNYHLKYHNPSNMTDEQKMKYAELMEIVDKPTVEVKVEELGNNEDSQMLWQSGQVVRRSGEVVRESGQMVSQNGQGLGQSGEESQSVEEYVEAQELIEDGQEYLEISELLEKDSDSGEVKKVYVLDNNSWSTE